MTPDSLCPWPCIGPSSTTAIFSTALSFNLRPRKERHIPLGVLFLNGPHVKNCLRERLLVGRKNHNNSDSCDPAAHLLPLHVALRLVRKRDPFFSPVGKLEPGQEVVRDDDGPGFVEDPSPLLLRQGLNVILASLPPPTRTYNSSVGTLLLVRV